jgi:hypothetical protein
MGGVRPGRLIALLFLATAAGCSPAAQPGARGESGQTEASNCCCR